MTTDLTIYRFPEIKIHHLLYDELGKEALDKLNSTFKGTPLVYSPNQVPEAGQPIRHSNIRTLFLDQVVRELTNSRISVPNPEQILANWNNIQERDTTYADSSLVIYPNVGPAETHRQRALEIAGFSNTTTPITISGLTIKPSDNKYGFTLEPTDYTSHKEAPWLKKTQRVAYNPETEEIEPSKDGVMVYVPEEQSGLRRLFRNWDELSARNGRLLDANEFGRVQVVQDPQDSRADLD